MSKTQIIGGKILKERALQENTFLNFENTFEETGILAENKADKTLFQTVWEIPSDWILSPGFIDIHIHGMAGKDVMDGDIEGLAFIADTLVKCGVTTWLGTTMTMKKEDIQKALATAKVFKSQQEKGERGGAKMAGIHLEGPYINPMLKGAQKSDYILEPNFKQFERDFYDIDPSLIKHITCAPEMEGALDFIKGAKARGISIALGHSGCTFDQAVAAKEAGATHITHFFNGMPPTHHREPGLVGAGLLSDLSIEWIADGVHFRPEWFPFLMHLKQEKGILVTDAMCAAGLCPGRYSLGGQDVTVDENSARLEGGVLAGSILTMDQAVRNMVMALPDKVGEILYAASSGPANVAGLNQVGRICKGYKADIVLLDAELKIQAVWAEGLLLYHTPLAASCRKFDQTQ